MIARVCALLIVGVLVGAQSAYASTIGLQLSSGGNTVTISANGSVTSSGSVSTQASSASGGVVSWQGTLGNWSVNFTQGIGSQVLGPGYIDLNSFNVSSGGPGTLTVTLSQANTGTTIGGGGMVIPGFTMAIGGTMASNFTNVQYTTYFNASNTLFAQQQQLGTLTFNKSGAFSASSSTSVNISAPYSLTQVLSVTSSGGTGSFSANATLSPVPEPASLLLLGGGLSGVALLTRLRRSKSAKR